MGTVLATGIGVALLFSIGGAYLLARAALRPVDTVTSATREMARTTSQSACPWRTRRMRSGASPPR
jgi:hypothetical protein